MPNERLIDRGLIVTGAASGIGRAAALKFAREGASVLVADRDVPGGERTCQQIVEAGGSAAFQEVDVTNEASVEAMVAACIERFGKLSGAFNNAGVSEPPTPFEDTDLASWNRILAIDLTGVFLCMKHEIIHLKQNGGGAIVNTSSVAGVAVAPGRLAYTAAKHGVLGITKQAAREHARNGIRVNAICPGLIDTPGLRGSTDEEHFARLAEVTAPGRMADASEIGDVAAWLLSNEASYVSGETIIVDYAGVTR